VNVERRALDQPRVQSVQFAASAAASTLLVPRDASGSTTPAVEVVTLSRPALPSPGRLARDLGWRADASRRRHQGRSFPASPRRFRRSRRAETQGGTDELRPQACTQVMHMGPLEAIGRVDLWKFPDFVYELDLCELGRADDAPLKERYRTARLSGGWRPTFRRSGGSMTGAVFLP